MNNTKEDKSLKIDETKKKHIKKDTINFNELIREVHKGFLKVNSLPITGKKMTSHKKDTFIVKVTYKSKIITNNKSYFTIQPVSNKLKVIKRLSDNSFLVTFNKLFKGMYKYDIIIHSNKVIFKKWFLKEPNHRYSNYGYLVRIWLKDTTSNSKIPKSKSPVRY